MAYSPGASVTTPPSWRSRPFRSSTGSRRYEWSGRNPVAQTIDSIPPVPNRPDLSWLEVDVFDRRGRVVHDGGITASPGLYLMGLPFLRRRRSTFIDGAGADARELADHLVGHLTPALRRAS